MIRRQAMVLARKAAPGTTVSDLCACGFSGLFEALVRAPALPAQTDLDAYLRYRIRAAMLDYMKAADPTVRSARHDSRRLVRAIRLLESITGRCPSRPEIARALDLGEPAYCDMLDRVRSGGMARLDVMSVDNCSFGRAAVAAPGTLAEAIERLPRQEREVLRIVHEDRCSVEEAAALLGAAVEAIERLLTEAVHRMRAALGPE